MDNKTLLPPLTLLGFFLAKNTDQHETKRSGYESEADQQESVARGPIHQTFLRHLPFSRQRQVEKWEGCSGKAPVATRFVPRAPRTKHALSQAAQLQVGVLEGVLHLLVQGLLLAVQQDGAAAVQDPLRGTFHDQQVSGLRRVGVLVDGQLERTVRM